MRSKPATTKHGVAVGSGGGGLFIFSAIFLLTACPLTLLIVVPSDGLCLPSEREALLNLKRDLTDPSNALSSWVEDHEDTHGNGDGVDCCHWVGVVCHNLTGHVLQLRLGCCTDGREAKVLGGKLSPSLLGLKELTHLDLSGNYFEGIAIPRFLGSLQSLTYLNLSFGGFGGMIPQHLGNLSNLHSLDLGSSYDSKLRSDSLRWVTGLSKLQYLDLSYVNLSKAVDWLQATNTLPSLTQLHLSECWIITAAIPTTLVLNFSHLSVLDLSRNDLYSPVPEWIFSLRALTSLDLSVNSLSGPIPVELGNLTGLTTLHLSYNSFNSSIPKWLFGDLNKLEVLDLGSNSLEGGIPDGIQNMTALSSLHLGGNSGLQGVGHKLIKSLGNLCNLRELGLKSIKLGQEGFEALTSLPGSVLSGLVGLHLGDTQLTGKFGKLVDKLAQSKDLATLFLYSNSLHGPIPESIGRLSSLESLSVINNQLNGTLPVSLGQLTRLRELYISDNQLAGDVTQAHFSNLTELTSLYASGNKLSLKVGPKWVPPFQLDYLDLCSWQNIGPRFPQWLQSQTYLTSLQLSGVGISSSIPDWFQKSSPYCGYYNLSHNRIYGDISTFVQSDFLDNTTIDLGSNRLGGPLPPISPLVERLDLSNNRFSGSISHFLCHKPSEPNHLKFLDLGKNNMSGEISDCWMNWRSLRFINFEYNEFTGQIPSSIQYLGDLESLHLRNNHFQGELPTSLRNCASLVVMDLAENYFLGRIPSWMGERLAALRVLILGSNRFFGNIPHQLCALTSLQVLDLAHNNLSGSIPTCFDNFTAMTIDHKYKEIGITSTIMWDNGIVAGGLLDHASIITKDRMDEYSTILGLMTCIDLSNNILSGEIPRELTSLTSLRYLNLSNNRLTGRTPDKMGVMKVLESIDFSTNQLFGVIPASMSDLTSISHFNVSNNYLEGKIPLSTQLQSLNASSFYGNQLCGPPLNDICSRASTDPDEIEEENTGKREDMELLYMTMVIGFVVGFLFVWTPLLFVKSWRRAYFRLVDKLWQGSLL